ncbi:BamA/TamA family outer membrane protein [Sphingobacterium faecium]|jgi:outer membrane protein insertion porin family|uniref:translocation and assembly module lipoprotein TamL n=1 Tax=Sphingobacterium faecium TaxID=34087 RepID=UPI0004E5FAD5|nr:BamA/TamA family outer membrane protein [Sphingobacterium faecium]WGQ15964.1 BamA/TamA family outer membrane protein [Sphingobacterium faecium]CDS98541.1 Outer membrane protein [Sphingobacterium sp. PM2-P1-29]
MINNQRFLAFTSITLLLLIFTSCRSARFLNEDQALIDHVNIQGVRPELKESASLYVSNDIKANSRVNLFIYNLFNTKDGKYKKRDLRNVGEAPHLLDSSLVDLSATQIKRFLFTKGFFDAKVQPEILVKNKRATINFNITEGIPYYMDKISYNFADSAVAHLYEQEVKNFSVVKEGSQYDAVNLITEREKLYLAMRNHGYYDYIRQYMRVAVDSTSKNNRLKLEIQVENPSDSANHQAYKIDQVFVTIRNFGTVKKEARKITDSISQIHFTDETRNFRLKPLKRYMYIKSGDYYNLSKENMAYDRLYEMNGFRSIKIHYQKTDSNTLDAYYEMVPRPLMGNQIEGEFTLSSGMSGFNIGNTFSHRNIFGGAELLEVKLRYGILFDPRLQGNISDKIFNNDVQIGVNLIVPRLMTPFHTNHTAQYGLAKTTFSSSLQIFNQDATYSNRYFINTLNYSWHQSANKFHSFTPIVLEYRQGKLNENFAQNLIDQGYLLYVRSNNREYFGLGSQYSFIYNAKKLTKKENFNYFKGSIDLSGNILDLVSKVIKFDKNADGEKKVLGVPYLQYAKTELDYRIYRNLGGNQQFVFRINPGIAVPYGNNSTLMIFEKSFYGGGMNGMRAWQARTLGPGNYNRASVQEDLRLNLRNLDQLGEIKIEGNAEYRFRILNSFLGAKMNGATFIDFGNVWRLKENELNPGGEFKADKFLKQIAIGTGFGLRFDSDYFIIRLDAGLKVKDPQFSGSDQWVLKHFFDSKEFKDQYYQTHKPDRYNFIQYNFGIGLPF